MRKDHRPLFLKRFHNQCTVWYTERFLRPQFEHLGPHYHFMKPRFIELSGAHISLGENALVAASADRWVRLNTFGDGVLEIGDSVLITPGVRISAANRIEIGHGCMLASSVYITDADWHGVYDRVDTPGANAPVVLADNVWVGDSAVICKGVTIGCNSIVGAGAVVTKDVPDNVIVAGNPATVVKQLDPDRAIKSRTELYTQQGDYDQCWADLEKLVHGGNTIMGWLRAKWRPTRED